jgi:hypothetical protein
MNGQEIKQPIRKRSRLLGLIKSFLLATEAKIAFKTGLAASISLIIGLAYTKFLNRPDTLVSGLWCVMASIVVMQAHLGGTYKAAWIRFLGVLIGSIAGAIFIDMIGPGPITLGISVFLTIVFCALLNIKDSFRIAALSTAVIVIMGGLKNNDVDHWVFGFYRFLDSFIGIMVALIIARLLWPEKAIENLQKNIGKTLSLLNKYFRLAVDLEPETQRHTDLSFNLFGEIVFLLEENRDYIKESVVELFDEPLLQEHWMLITEQVETAFEAVDSLKHVHKETLSKIIDDSLSIELNAFIDKIDLSFQSLEQIILSQTKDFLVSELNYSIASLNAELLRFRGTRTTRKFNLEDVESYFVFFYSLRSIAEALVKMESQIDLLLLREAF